MKTRKHTRILALILLIFTAFLAVGCSNDPDQTTTPTAVAGNAQSDLELHFLDVGQGLSIFAKSGDQTMLYDGGDRDYSSFVVSYLKQQEVTDLDYVIASHYDSDHINGLIGALHTFTADTIIGPDYAPDTKTFRSLISQVSELGKEVLHPQPGDSFQFGDATITVLAPYTVSSNSNNNSVAIRIDYGQNSFIFTGDAEHTEETAMVDSGMNLECDVLVLGHHGSASSTSWDFLEKTVPAYAVISCGLGNSYGHPHEETMEKMESMEIELFRTDRQGTIIAVSDGDTISWNMEPSHDYASGDDDNTAAEAAKSAAAPAADSSAADPSQAQSSGIEADGADSAASGTAADFYVLNIRSKKVHLPSCSSVSRITAENYDESHDTLEDILAAGYDRCKNCLP